MFLLSDLLYQKEEYVQHHAFKAYNPSGTFSFRFSLAERSFQSLHLVGIAFHSIATAA